MKRGAFRSLIVGEPVRRWRPDYRRMTTAQRREAFRRRRLCGADIPEKARLAIFRIGQEFKGEFRAPLVKVPGTHAWEASLRRPHRAYRICRRLNDLLRPDFFRFVIGWGPPDSGGENLDRAHGALTIIKYDRRIYGFHFAGDRTGLDECLGSLAELVHVLRNGWTDQQRKIARAYETFGKQGEAATELGITQQAVSEALRLCHWRQARQAEKTINRVLASLGRPG
jgi:hypothetical protein